MSPAPAVRQTVSRNARLSDHLPVITQVVTLGPHREENL
jgi:hypothetical protein